MNTCITASDALTFLEEHGIVLVSAKGPVPRLTEAILGEPVSGNWWAHPQGRHIYAVIEAIKASPQVLVCRLIDGKVTLVHRRLWPALVRLAGRFPAGQLARIHEEHTPSGRHAVHPLAYPEWVPPDVALQGQSMDEQEALALLGAWLPTAKSPAKPAGGAAHGK